MSKTSWVPIDRPDVTVNSLRVSCWASTLLRAQRAPIGARS